MYFGELFRQKAIQVQFAMAHFNIAKAVCKGIFSLLNPVPAFSPFSTIRDNVFCIKAHLHCRCSHRKENPANRAFYTVSPPA
jgi:hypothetical protein